MSPLVYPAASNVDTAAFQVVSSADHPCTKMTGVWPDGVPVGRMVLQPVTSNAARPATSSSFFMRSPRR